VLPAVLRIFDALSMPGASLALLRLWLRIAKQDTRALLELMSRSAANSDTATMQTAYAALLAADPANRGAINNVANKFMSAGNTRAAMQLYSCIDDEEASIKPKLYTSAFMQPASVTVREPYVATLFDVTLETDHCAIFDREKVYWRESSGQNFAKHPYVRGRASGDWKFFAVSCPEPSTYIERPFILLGTDGGRNYSHWLTRNVLKLALVERAALPASMPLMINADMAGYQLEFIDLLGIPRVRLMPVKVATVIRCREVHVPTTLRLHAKMSIGIDWLRKRLAHLIEPPGDARDLLYISRRDSGHRVLLNEGELETSLQQLGFKTVVLDGMPVAEQIRTFSRARVIVGAHGAGLTNLMFAPPSAAVVEITNTKIRHMGDFREITQQMGQRYIEVVSGWFPDHQRHEVSHEIQRHDYLINVDDAIQAIREAMVGG